MTAKNNLTTQGFNNPLLLKRALIGAAIGLVLILSFVLRATKPVPAHWGQFWMIQPLIITPLAGAVAGVCNHFLDFLRNEGRTQTIIANILAVLIYIIGLWMGTVLGLNGTMWN